MLKVTTAIGAETETTVLALALAAALAVLVTLACSRANRKQAGQRRKSGCVVLMRQRRASQTER